MKKIILLLSIIFASGLTMVTVYNTIVDAASWGSNLPSSVAIARQYYKFVDPRKFFAIIAPINQLLILLSVISFWKESLAIRRYLIGSFLFYAFVAAITFVCFFPLDKVIFTSDIEGHQEQIKKALAQWRALNWLRTMLGLTGTLFSLEAHIRVCKKMSCGQ